MKRNIWTRFSAVILGTALLSVFARAQGTNEWFFECIDPLNTTPYSTDYGTSGVRNTLMHARIGLGGTVTYGGTNGPCYGAAKTLPAVGRFCFASGSVGSVQSDFDDGLAYTTGYPRDPVGSFCYAMIAKDPDPKVPPTTFFGNGGLQGFFTGASNRYFKAFWSDADVDITLRVDVIADAARMEWNMTNLKTTTAPIGLWFGAYVGMRTANAGILDSTGANQANSSLGTATGRSKFTAERYIGYTFVPTTKPLRTEKHFFRSRSNFPKYANFEFGQTEPYGMQVNLDKTVQLDDQASADEFLIGNFGDFTQPGLLINGAENTMRNRVFNGKYEDEEADIILTETSFVQIFYPTLVEANATRVLVNYMKSTWSVGDYVLPYAAVVDAPRVIATTTGTNGARTPNPFTIRAYIDNQYARIDKEIALNDVKISITLPNGLTLAPGETATKIIGKVDANEISFVEWQVEADEFVFGPQNYSVKYQPVPGPTKTVTGTILLASTPRFHLKSGPNLITLPWNFPDTSLESIFKRVTVDNNGNEVEEALKLGKDFSAYRWDTEQSAYTVSSSADRGRGVWIVVNQDIDNLKLTGASTPSDQASGGYLYNLTRGWNLIGNPYSYPITLSNLVAVAEDDSKNAISWVDLVSQEFVSPALAYFEADPNNPAGGAYKFTNGIDFSLQPHTGYWLFVSTFRPIRLSWPAVYTEGLPDSGRKDTSWKQTDKKWRLQLTARTSQSLDSQNFIAVAGSAKEVKQLWIPKPPTVPGQKIELAIEETRDGQPTRMAQSAIEKAGHKEFKVLVTAKEAGEATVTWPNLTTVPRNMKFKLTDKSTSTTRDLRSASGYTFKFDQPGTREFTLTMDQGGSTRAVIGNVVVSKPTKDVNAPFTIAYALSSDASTSIRILSGSGKEVFTISRGRADSSGQNTATWAMRDNANRAVAPGTYRVEILAETANGERVRKIVPLNVIR